MRRLIVVPSIDEARRRTNLDPDAGPSEDRKQPATVYGHLHQPHYGARYDEIVIDLPAGHLTGADQKYLEHLRCRLAPDGKWIE